MDLEQKDGGNAAVNDGSPQAAEDEVAEANDDAPQNEEE